jgi:hypothetical protein
VVGVSTPELVVGLGLSLRDSALRADVAAYLLSRCAFSCRTLMIGADIRLPKPLEKSTSEPRRADDVAVKGSHRPLSISTGLGLFLNGVLAILVLIMQN